MGKYSWLVLGLISCSSPAPRPAASTPVWWFDHTEVVPCRVVSVKPIAMTGPGAAAAIAAGAAANAARNAAHERQYREWKDTATVATCDSAIVFTSKKPASRL